MRPLLTEEGVERSPPRENPLWNYASVVKFLQSLAIMIILVVFYLREIDYRTSNPIISPNMTVDQVYLSATRVENANCSDSNDCTRDFLFVEADFCEHILEPPGTPCDNTCYVENAATTTCSRTGMCSGNITECRGHCTTDADCVTAIPFDPAWLTNHARAGWNNFEYVVVKERHICELNRCVAFVFHMFVNPDTVNYAQPIGAFSNCDAFLLPSFVEERVNCLTMQRALLAVNVTDVSQFMPAEVNSPPQFSMCSYYYNCAALNQTQLALNLPVI